MSRKKFDKDIANEMRAAVHVVAELMNDGRKRGIKLEFNIAETFVDGVFQGFKPTININKVEPL